MRYAVTAGAVSAAPEGWTEDRVGLLRKLWAEGFSASQIAGRLGECTRNAVIGKVHRLGLPGRKTETRSVRFRGRSIARRPASAVAQLRNPVIQRRCGSGHSRPPLPVAVLLPAPDPLFAALLDLGHGQCRWPFGDPREAGFAFCGRPTNRISYCGHHSRIAHQPASRRKR